MGYGIKDGQGGNRGIIVILSHFFDEKRNRIS